MMRSTQHGSVTPAPEVPPTLASEGRRAPLVPGPPLLGNLPALLREQNLFFARVGREQGDVARLEFPFGPPLYQVNDPELVEQVLLTRAGEFHRDAFSRNLRVIVGDGMFTVEGERWRRQRRLMQPLFTPRSVAAYEHAMIEETSEVAAGWADGQRIDLLSELNDLTIRILVRAVFPRPLLERERKLISDVADASNEYLKGVLSTGRCLPIWMPTPRNQALKRALAALDPLVYALIASARRQSERGTDLVTRLLDSRDELGREPSDLELRDEIVTFFMAGHETTSIAATYALWALSRHPEALARVRGEIANVLGGRPPEPKDLAQLPLVGHAVTEALRLYPPAWCVPREVRAPTRLGPYTLEAGAGVLVVPFAIQRSPRHFANPEAFLPQRWEDGLARRLHRFAYLPFGGGPRVCMGSHFALRELALILTVVLQKWDLQGDADAKLVLRAGTTLRPSNKLWATVRRAALPVN